MHKLFPFVKAGLWLVFISFLSLMPGDDFSQNQLFNLPHFDKIVHFVLYLVLCLLLFNPLKKYSNHFLWIAPTLSFFVGGIFELLQYLLINKRDGSMYDILANLCGICFAFVVYKYILPKNIIRKYF